MEKQKQADTAPVDRLVMRLRKGDRIPYPFEPTRMCVVLFGRRYDHKEPSYCVQWRSDQGDLVTEWLSESILCVT